MTEIIVALISAGASMLVGVLALIGIIISNKNAKKEMLQRMEIAQAVTDTKIDALTREVREHNNFAKRMPVVETKLELMKEDINTLQDYHR